MDLETLIERVGPQVFEEACAWAWATAVGSSLPTARAEAWSEAARNVPHLLEDALWCEGDASALDRVSLFFALYRRMPCYGNLLYTKHVFPTWDAPAKARFWVECRALLDDEDERLATPVGYALWCDYFEDVATVDEAWRGLGAGEGLGRRGLERLLDASGPVPYPLKGPLYERLVEDPSWHPVLFRSLSASAFEHFGSVDPERAQALLSRLTLPSALERPALEARLEMLGRRAATF